jgi:hypothetical protein
VIQIVIMKDKTQPSVDHTIVIIKNMYYTLHGILNRTEMHHFFYFFLFFDKLKSNASLKERLYISTYLEDYERDRDISQGQEGKSKPVRHFLSKFYGTRKINRKKKLFPTAKILG